MYKRIDVSKCYFDFKVLGLALERLPPETFHGSDFFSSIKLANTHHLPKKKIKDLKYAFFYAFGCIVLWNFSNAEQEIVIRNLSKLVQDPMETSEKDKIQYIEPTNHIDESSFISISRTIFASNYVESDEEEPTKTNGNTYIKNELIKLNTTQFQEKLAVSRAMAQSIKMNYFEEDINKFVENETGTKKIAVNINITLQKTNISQKLGVLSLKKCRMNLQDSLLPDPQFQRRKNMFFREYRSILVYFQLKERLSIANVKLKYMHDIYKSQLKELTKKTKLYMDHLIIFMIFLEILEAFAELFFGLINYQNIFSFNSPLRFLRKTTSQALITTIQMGIQTAAAAYQYCFSS